jgi:hypothetical protein
VSSIATYLLHPRHYYFVQVHLHGAFPDRLHGTAPQHTTQKRTTQSVRPYLPNPFYREPFRCRVSPTVTHLSGCYCQCPAPPFGDHRRSPRSPPHRKPACATSDYVTHSMHERAHPPSPHPATHKQRNNREHRSTPPARAPPLGTAVL